MSTPQNHHFVPKVYLERFAADKSGIIYKLNKNIHRAYAKPVNISGVCYEKNLYRLFSDYYKDLHGIEDENYIEKNSFWYEKEILRNLFDIMTKQEIIYRTDYTEILKIIVSIKRRNPVMRTFFDNHNISNDSVENKFQDLVPFLEGVGLSEELIEEYRKVTIEKFLKMGNDLTFRRGMYLTGHLREIENQNVVNIIEILSKWDPIIMYTSIDCPFVCSDNPGHTLNKNGYIFNTNIDNINYFTFPLSSTHCLILRKNIYNNPYLIKMRIPKVPASLNDIRVINNCTYANCDKYILSNSKTELIITKEFVKEK